MWLIQALVPIMAASGRCSILHHSMSVRGGKLHERQHVCLQTFTVDGTRFFQIKRDSQWARLLSGRAGRERPLAPLALWSVWQRELNSKVTRHCRQKSTHVILSLPESHGSSGSYSFRAIAQRGEYTMECCEANLNWLINYIHSEVSNSASSASEGHASV